MGLLALLVTEIATWKGLQVAMPRGFLPEDCQALKDVAPQVRLPVKLRVLADWLDRDHEAFLHRDIIGQDIRPTILLHQ